MVRAKKHAVYAGNEYTLSTTKTNYDLAKKEAEKVRATGKGAIVKNVAKNLYAIYELEK